MCHGNELYWEAYLSDQINTQTVNVISLNTYGQDELLDKMG